MKKNALNAGLFCGVAAMIVFAAPICAQTPATLDLRLFAGINITGTAGSIYVVQFTENLASSNSWRSIAFLQTLADSNLGFRVVLAIGP